MNILIPKQISFAVAPEPVNRPFFSLIPPVYAVTIPVVHLYMINIHRPLHHIPEEIYMYTLEYNITCHVNYNISYGRVSWREGGGRVEGGRRKESAVSVFTADYTRK